MYCHRGLLFPIILLCGLDVPNNRDGYLLPASSPVAKATPSMAVPTATSLGTLKSGISGRGEATASGFTSVRAAGAGAAAVEAARAAAAARLGKGKKGRKKKGSAAGGRQAARGGLMTQ